MTVERGQPTLPVDPQASLRTELSAQLAVAQLALEAAIAELSRNGGDSITIAASRSQLSSVSDLLRQVGTASVTRLAELRSEVASTAASATALASQATGSIGDSAATNANLTSAQRARATIEAVGRELFEKRVLDPYLQFSSPEDEEAYRKREREREAEIASALALKTPDGDRRAAELVQSQLRDAKAHGGDRSPDFASLSADADGALATLQGASKLPVDPTREALPPAKPAKASTTSELDDVAATFKIAGVTLAETPPATVPGHGLAGHESQRRDPAQTLPSKGGR